MTRPNPILLMTRPAEASTGFFNRLPDRVRAGLDLRISPLMEIVPVAGAIAFGEARAVIFTSANGVAVASERTARRDLDAYCVGKATTRTAMEAGWPAHCAGTTAEELVETLATMRATGPMLHLSGVHTRGRIAERLSDAGCLTRRQPVYQQRLIPLSAEAKALLSGDRPVIAPVFSPRSARHFADQCPEVARPCLVALSAAVAEALSGLPGARVIIANRPDAESVAVCIQSVLNRLCRVESNPDAQ